MMKKIIYTLFLITSALNACPLKITNDTNQVVVIVDREINDEALVLYPNQEGKIGGMHHHLNFCVMTSDNGLKFAPVCNVKQHSCSLKPLSYTVSQIIEGQISPHSFDPVESVSVAQLHAKTNN